jgi:hypothetical protein
MNLKIIRIYNDECNDDGNLYRHGDKNEWGLDLYSNGDTLKRSNLAPFQKNRVFTVLFFLINNLYCILNQKFGFSFIYIFQLFNKAYEKTGSDKSNLKMDFKFLPVELR